MRPLAWPAPGLNECMTKVVSYPRLSRAWRRNGTAYFFALPLGFALGLLAFAFGFPAFAFSFGETGGLAFTFGATTGFEGAFATGFGAAVGFAA